MSLSLHVVFHRALLEWDFVDLAATEMTLQMLKQIVHCLSQEVLRQWTALPSAQSPATALSSPHRRIPLSRKQADELLLRSASFMHTSVDGAPSEAATEETRSLKNSAATTLCFPSAEWVHLRKDGVAVSAGGSSRLCDALSCEPASSSGCFSPVTLHVYRVDPRLQLGSARRATQQHVPSSNIPNSSLSSTASSPSPHWYGASVSPHRFFAQQHHLPSGHLGKPLASRAATSATPVRYRATLDGPDDGSSPARPKLSPERPMRAGNVCNAVRVFLDV